MSFTLPEYNEIPIELKKVILSYTIPNFSNHELLNEQVRKFGRMIVNWSTTCKEFYDVYKEKLEQFKKIYSLYCKYSAYNSLYEKSREDVGRGKKFNPIGNPQLLDALFTGCIYPSASSTFKVYTVEIEEDIKFIVMSTPGSMSCTLGNLRVSQDIPILTAACLNKKIPIHIIRFLLENGANPMATCKINFRTVTLLDDLEINVNLEYFDLSRFNAIKELFGQFGVGLQEKLKI